jgi:PPM family protein phosphatase
MNPTGPRNGRRPFHTEYATYGAVQCLGTRTVQADAYTVLRDPVTRRIAVAVADGIGDQEEPAWIAKMGADYAVGVAIRTGSAARAIREARARRNMIELGYPDYDPRRDYWSDEADTVLAVAVIQPGAGAIRVAWTGDCRVYRLGHTGLLGQVTTDHTEGERLRRLGVIESDEPPCRADSIVTSRLAYGPIGTTAVPVELVRRLLVCSDGIGKQLEPLFISTDLECAGDAREAVEFLAEDALEDGLSPEERGYSDNITAVVLDLAQASTGRHW